MKKWFFLLLVVCSQAWADMHFIGKNKEFGMFVDPSTVERNGDSVKLWVIGDYQEAQSKRFPPPLFWVRYLSVKELKEFDCTKALHRTIRTKIFSEKLAKGDLLYTFDAAATMAPVSNAPLDVAQFKYACEDGRR